MEQAHRGGGAGTRSDIDTSTDGVTITRLTRSKGERCFISATVNAAAAALRGKAGGALEFA